MADPDTPKKKLSPGAWEEARTLVWAHRNRLMLGLFLMIINRLAGLVLPSTSKWLMDDVVGKQHWDLLPMLALAAYTAHNLPDGMEPGLKETAFYDPTNFTFPAGAYICELEVDPGTGKTSFVNFVAADDFGRLINPMIVEGQVHGGLAQGIGQALLEGAVYDSSGQLVTASFMDYTMPRADDLPSFKLSHTTTLCPGNPLGVKGCGEAGAIGASAAVINAITDAIGNNKLEMPATPDRVWHAIHGNA